MRSIIRSCILLYSVFSVSLLSASSVFVWIHPHVWFTIDRFVSRQQVETWIQRMMTQYFKKSGWVWHVSPPPHWKDWLSKPQRVSRSDWGTLRLFFLSQPLNPCDWIHIAVHAPEFDPLKLYSRQLYHQLPISTIRECEGRLDIETLKTFYTLNVSENKTWFWGQFRPEYLSPMLEVWPVASSQRGCRWVVRQIKDFEKSMFEFDCFSDPVQSSTFFHHLLNFSRTIKGSSLVKLREKDKS